MGVNNGSAARMDGLAISQGGGRTEDEEERGLTDVMERGAVSGNFEPGVFTFAFQSAASPPR